MGSKPTCGGAATIPTQRRLALARAAQSRHSPVALRMTAFTVCP